MEKTELRLPKVKKKWLADTQETAEARLNFPS